MLNKNHPKKGSTIKVEPIRHKKDIERVKSILVNQPRNLALFTLGINTNLRAGDLSRLKCKIIDSDSFEIREKKTGKLRRLTLNNGTLKVVTNWIKTANLKSDDLLFPLQVTSIHRLVKGWCRKIGLKGNYGSHTLRKTWGYHAWKAGIDLPRLMVIFNHSSQKQTLDYLCIQAEEIQEVYLKVEL